MVIVDEKLKARSAAGKPIMVGLAGAGFMGRGIVNQLANYLPGMRLAAIFSRNPNHAYRACIQAGMADVQIVESLTSLNSVIARGGCGVTPDPELLCRSELIEVLIDATGSVEFGAVFAQNAVSYRKDLVLMNAELDGTIGPILKVHADHAGVIITGCDGDQPGVQLNLYRFVKSLGLIPLVCGNIKGLQDRSRNPTTQAGFAKQWGQTPHMVTSFADGTKISFEQAIVANATGMQVARTGMIGYEHEGHIDELTNYFNVEELKACGGIVDYVVGSAPSPGVFIFAAAADDTQKLYLDYGKLGKGPLYSFYVPYHLTIFEVALSAARVVLFRDSVISPLHGPKVDVISVAKTDLKAGEFLDGLGGYKTYGLCENADLTQAEGHLPIGLAEGCRLNRGIKQHETIGYTDVVIPSGRIVDGLRDEQDVYFYGSSKAKHLTHDYA